LHAKLAKACTVAIVSSPSIGARVAATSTVWPNEGASCKLRWSSDRNEVTMALGMVWFGAANRQIRLWLGNEWKRFAVWQRWIV
jgi:hypothetical protein